MIFILFFALSVGFIGQSSDWKFTLNNNIKLYDDSGCKTTDECLIKMKKERELIKESPNGRQ